MRKVLLRLVPAFLCVLPVGDGSRLAAQDASNPYEPKARKLAEAYIRAYKEGDLKGMLKLLPGGYGRKLPDRFLKTWEDRVEFLFHRPFDCGGFEYRLPRPDQVMRSGGGNSYGSVAFRAEAPALPRESAEIIAGLIAVPPGPERRARVEELRANLKKEGSVYVMDYSLRFRIKGRTLEFEPPDENTSFWGLGSIHLEFEKLQQGGEPCQVYASPTPAPYLADGVQVTIESFSAGRSVGPTDGWVVFVHVGIANHSPVTLSTIQVGGMLGMAPMHFSNLGGSLSGALSEFAKSATIRGGARMPLGPEASTTAKLMFWSPVYDSHARAEDEVGRLEEQLAKGEITGRLTGRCIDR